MKLIYNVQDKPSFGKTVVFAIQQLLAIMAATIAVPAIINQSFAHANMSATAALFGAGVGTLVYLLFTKFKSPVFLGSSFAFIGSMCSAFAGAASAALGYLGIILGAIFAGLVYVVISLIVKYVGVQWINKLMPPVIIGPTVAIIGLSLAGNAIGDLTKQFTSSTYSLYASLFCGLVTFFTVVICSVYGKKMLKMIPFIIGILAGYVAACILTGIGFIFDVESFKIINFSLFKDIQWIPDFTFITAFGGFKDLSWSYVGTVAVAYIPVAFVVFAEHIADHKNLSSIIEQDLLTEPGLNRTLLGDGVGSMAGALFGGCPNTTYGESVGCVAISGNASIKTIFFTAIMAIIISFFGPFSTFLATIPSCVMGGVCVALYGFIAVSGLKMIQKVDLNDNKNLFVVSVILIAGVGGIVIPLGQVTITTVACALILGIVTNFIVNLRKPKEEKGE
ncbi:MAG: uracil-xanthine permease [Bacilli bacterium]|nr:uracil-xanthine permease [Bacilli bacterium]